MTEASFEAGENWDGKRREVFFHGQIVGVGRLVVCRISTEALRECFGAATAERAELLSAFRSQRRHIEEIAARLMKNGRNEADGTILIRKEDIE